MKVQESPSLVEVMGENFSLNGVSLISLLHQIQEHYNYLPEEVLREVAEKTGIPPIEVYRVATFYKAFSLVPRGKHKVVVCCGTACHVRGSEKVVEEISRILGVKPGGTTADARYSLETVNCLGACALAPLVAVDNDYYGRMTPSKIRRLFRKNRKLQKGVPAGE